MCVFLLAKVYRYEMTLTCLGVVCRYIRAHTISGKAIGIFSNLSLKVVEAIKLTAISRHSFLARKSAKRWRLSAATLLAHGSAPSWSASI